MPRFVKNSPYLPWSLATASRQFAIRARPSVLRSYRLLEQAQGAWNRLDIRARGRGVGRSASLPAALRIQGQAAMRNAILTIAAALLLSACAASPPAHGNAKGGVIDWFGTNSVQAEADRRKQYGKLARITEMRAEAGGRVRTRRAASHLRRGGAGDERTRTVAGAVEPYVRLCEKQRAAICEWHRLSNPQPPPYIETVGGRSPTVRQRKGDACRQAPRTMYANK
jgi:hypothetical protein